ncbi:secretion protein HlyD [Brevibacillus reuszeri]|uniref:efflux RND transporter periplasmic adaptor subunit n=1 Tax=Brevibacillus reuszeri TaxID=54915 RepID=UPI001B1E8926|nr:efflux RND transporter periplasmic adaptor subunit [Brevibacillus reuszeri]GIO09962.1 secretion protein HlyD [Brevibacillus reuszeri]
MNKRRMSAITASLMLTMGLVLVGCTDEQEKKEEAPPVSVSIPVTVLTVKEAMLSNERTYIGSISAEDTSTVVTQASGTLTKLYVKKGDSVKKGQLIGEIDSTKQQLDVEEQESKLASAIARLAQAKASQDADTKEVSSARVLAKQALDNAKESYDRVKALVEAGALPAAQLGAAEDEWVRAQNSYRTSTQSEAKDLAGIQVSAADVEAAKLAVEKAKRALADSIIKAPMDGVINQLSVSVGDMIANQGTVGEIVALDPVMVTIQVAEDALPSLKKGMSMQLSIPALGTKTEGEIAFVGLSAARDTKLFPVEIRLPNRDLVYRPGMRADVTVTGTKEQKGIVLPIEALLELDGKQYVYVVKGDRAYKQEIEKIESDTQAAVISQGLAPGDRVVVAGQSDLQDGSQVSIIEYDKKGE